MMIKKRIVLFAVSLISLAGMAQESVETNPVLQTEVKLSYLDSIKLTFTRDTALYRIDSLWMKEMANQDLFDTIQADLENIDPDKEVDYNLPTPVLKERLAELDSKTPFHIEYNKELENIIKSYLKNRPKSFERLMAISQYYFPMIEEKLAKYNIPMELKYLAVIESALNPRAKSRVGATGLWQFMYPTGKQFNLEVDSYVDERCDPLKATEAACQYLSSLYNIFGDWDLVLASYNAGPGNVTKAMRRSGNYTNYWNIRNKLPRETRAYVPAFLATMYVYEYGKDHGIAANNKPIAYFETDTVMVKHQMNFQQVAQLLDVPVQQLEFLNPVYKLDVVPYTTDKAHYIRLPKNKVGLFVTNEDAIYAYVKHEESLREKPFFATQQAYASANGKITKVTTKTYVVRSGDNLGEISNKYDVSVTDIKKWNRLRSNMIRVGQRLRIQKTIVVDAPEPKEAIAVKETKKEAKKQPEKESKEIKEAIVPQDDNDAVADNDDDTIVIMPPCDVEDAVADADTDAPQLAAPAIRKNKDINYEQERMYIVQKGDSLFSIARKHPGVTVENLKKWNRLDGNSLKPGMKLKVGVAD